MDSETIQVLHVDDEPGFSDLVSEFIQRGSEDITIETETDPRQCLKMVEQDSHDLDCIVSDYDMPHLNGLEMLEVVRNQYPEFPFILFTGKGSEEIAAEAISTGVDEYMQKGSGTDQYKILANRIRQQVRQARTEQALRNSEAKYRALVEQNIVGIYLIQDNQFTYVNPLLAGIFGYDQDEVIGQTPLSLVAEDDQDLVDENIRKRMEGKTDTIHYRFKGLTKDGRELSILAQGRAIELNSDPAVAGVLLDIDDLEIAR